MEPPWISMILFTFAMVRMLIESRKVNATAARQPNKILPMARITSCAAMEVSRTPSAFHAWQGSAA
jgi:hypothetical protein